MDTPILEAVAQIAERGKFKKGRKSDAALKSEIEKLFRMHKQEGTEDTAKMVYSGVIDLAKLGKSQLAKSYAMRFEEEVGYEQF